MKLYELIYLSSTDLSKEELNLLQEKIISLIREVGGELLVGESLANTFVRKKLASPIKNKGEAYFTALSFRFEPEKLENLEKKLKLENQILRYLILVKPKPEKLFEPKPTQILPARLAFGNSKAGGPRKTLKKKPKVELKEIEKKLDEILDEGDEG